MKKIKANYIFIDRLYAYLLDEKGIYIYRKDENAINEVINIKHPLCLSSDLIHNLLIIMNTTNTLYVYSLENFTLQFQVNLGGNISKYLFDKENLYVYATSTDLNKKNLKLFKIDIKTQKVLTKTYDKLSIVCPCFINDKVCVMIEEKISETIKEINILDVDINDLNIIKRKQTSQKIGPLFRVNDCFCYDYLNGFYNYIEDKLYTYLDFGINNNCVLYVKYYNEQYYIFARQDTYVLSKELKMLYHFNNESIDGWINDMLIEEDNVIYIRNNGIQITKKNNLIESKCI